MSSETAQNKTVRESNERAHPESSEWFAVKGVPMVKIKGSATELIPTVQYGNVVVGPVSLERFVADGDDNHLRREISKTQELLEEAVAEERQSIQALIRARAGTENGSSR